MINLINWNHLQLLVDKCSSFSFLTELSMRLNVWLRPYQSPRVSLKPPSHKTSESAYSVPTLPESLSPVHHRAPTRETIASVFEKAMVSSIRQWLMLALLYRTQPYPAFSHPAQTAQTQQVGLWQHEKSCLVVIAVCLNLGCFFFTKEKLLSYCLLLAAPLNALWGHLVMHGQSLIGFCEQNCWIRISCGFLFVQILFVSETNKWRWERYLSETFLPQIVSSLIYPCRLVLLPWLHSKY